MIIKGIKWLLLTALSLWVISYAVYLSLIYTDETRLPAAQNGMHGITVYYQPRSLEDTDGEIEVIAVNNNDYPVVFSFDADLTANMGYNNFLKLIFRGQFDEYSEPFDNDSIKNWGYIPAHSWAGRVIKLSQKNFDVAAALWINLDILNADQLGKIPLQNHYFQWSVRISPPFEYGKMEYFSNRIKQFSYIEKSDRLDEAITRIFIYNNKMQDMMVSMFDAVLVCLKQNGTIERSISPVDDFLLQHNSWRLLSLRTHTPSQDCSVTIKYQAKTENEKASLVMHSYKVNEPNQCRQTGKARSGSFLPDCFNQE